MWIQSGSVQQIIPATLGTPLHKESVHVWIIPIPTDPNTLAASSNILSVDETARAERFVFAKDRQLFTSAHVALRCILADYLHAAPTTITYAVAPRGKPALAGLHAASPLRFNLTHTRGLALCALAFGREVGIDVEAIDRVVDVVGVARQAFSPAERQALLRLDETERHEAFFRVWTRKEALVKALGEGLDEYTREFTVAVVDGETDALLSSAVDWVDVDAWRIQTLPCPPGFHGAVAAAGRDKWSVQIFRWAPP